MARAGDFRRDDRLIDLQGLAITNHVYRPQERSSGLVNIPSVGGLNLFVDPIESEIQVLGSATIKATVVDSRGMRLAHVPVEDARSLIMRDVWVAPDVPYYQSFRFIEESEGRYD